MKRTMILTVGLIAVTALVGCGGNNLAGPGAPGATATKEAQKDALLGVWQMQVNNGVPPLMTFKSDGGVEVTEAAGYGDPVTVSGTYKVDGEKIALTAREGQQDATVTALERFTTYTYSIDGKVLTLKKADGEVIKFEKR